MQGKSDIFLHFLKMKYDFNTKYITNNRLNLEKSIYTNIIKNMRKNCTKNQELKKERSKINM